MTGMLAVSGIVLVLLASAYSGLTNTDTTAADLPGLQITPVSDAGSGDQEGTTAETTPTPEATAEPTATPDPALLLNRQDCNQIRGTDYNSPEERTWFLANCVNN